LGLVFTTIVLRNVPGSMTGLARRGVHVSEDLPLSFERMSDETLEMSIDNHTAGLDENEKVVSIGHACRQDTVPDGERALVVNLQLFACLFNMMQDDEGQGAEYIQLKCVPPHLRSRGHRRQGGCSS